MLRTLRSIYPYTSIIYTLYATEDTDDQIIRFVQHNDITAVTLPENRVSGALVESLRQAGAVCYVNTINELKAAVKDEQMGVRWVLYGCFNGKRTKQTQLAVCFTALRHVS